MIYIVCTYLNPQTMMPMSNLEKTFNSLHEYNEYYKMVKVDPCVVLSVMSYNPLEFPNRKTLYDYKLLSLSRINPV